MKTLNKILIALALVVSITAHAQQDPMYTHYMYNTLMVNPGYAGSRDALTVTALNRSQWVGFKGAPITQSLTLHTPLINRHIGVGLSVLNDKIGPNNNSSVFVDFAYRMQITDKSKLALGVSGGANMFKSNLNTLELDQQNDVAFQNNINNRVNGNFGVGLYYSRERFYAGISAPNVLENNYAAINQPNGAAMTAKAYRHYYFIAGAIFNITDNLAFKPTTLVKVTNGAPLQADFTASFIIVKKLLLGGMFRTGDAAGALIGFDITNQLHAGYSFDWSYGLRTFKYNQGSHELMLRYDFIFSSKKQIHSPRYF